MDTAENRVDVKALAAHDVDSHRKLVDGISNIQINDDIHSLARSDVVDNWNAILSVAIELAEVGALSGTRIATLLAEDAGIPGAAPLGDVFADIDSAVASSEAGADAGMARGEDRRLDGP